MVMRMTKLSYWDKRYLRIKAQELENVANYESNLKPRLSSLEYELEQEANTWYSKYASNHDIDVDTAKQLLKTVGSTNWKMTLAEFRRKAIKGGYTKELDSEYFKSRIARLQDLEEQLKEVSSRFASDETDSLSNRLTDQFQETYMTTIFNTQVQQNKLTSNFARFNEDQIKYIVNQPWHKEDFSKRVWKNYRDELPGQLVDVMLRGTFMGYSPERITKMFQQRFEGIRRHQIHRLVITEMGHIAEQATSKAYEESGIEEYEYMATLESHTCEVCARLDGKIFKMSEKREGINYPLIHPHCRCTTVPYIEGLPDVKKRWMRDPITDKGRSIENMSYNDWYKAMQQNAADSIIGIRTSDGVNITGISQHLVDRSLERNVSIDDIKDALINPLKIFPVKVDIYGRPSKKYGGAKVTVAVNPETGNIATTYPTSTNRAKKWRSENDNQ
jgi:SPP1 gp7 family putative phage head morphogenesis protein